MKSNNIKCANCGTLVTCECQKRTASNGEKVCSTCIQGYEARLSFKN